LVPVRDIIGVHPDKKMKRVAARGIVALVAGALIIRQIDAREPKRQSVRQVLLPTAKPE
jgi:hypothetical protein